MKAILLNLIAWSLLPIMDGMAKYLSDEMHFIQVVWARYFFMVIITLPIIYIFFKQHLRWPKNIYFQLIRSIFLFLSTILFFYAISVISLTKSLALAFIYPIIVTLLSPWLLNEKVGIHRWFAVAIGFIGATIIFQPGFVEFNLASLAALGTGFAYAFYTIFTRKLSFVDSSVLTLVFTGLIGAIIVTIIVPWFWTMPNFNQLMLMIGMAIVGGLGHLFLILSLNYAEASKLAPFAYFEIVNNIIIGYYFFGDIPNKWLWIGLFFIISSGIYIAIRENITKSKS